MSMKNPQAYNQFIQSLELDAKGHLFFHRIEDDIYITDQTHRLLGIWDLENGTPRKP